MNKYLLPNGPKFFLKASSLTSTSSDLSMGYKKFSGDKQNCITLYISNCYLLDFTRLLLNPLDHIKNVQLLIVEFIISFNFKPTSGIHIYDKIYQTVEFCCEPLSMHH